MIDEFDSIEDRRPGAASERTWDRFGRQVELVPVTLRWAGRPCVTVLHVVLDRSGRPASMLPDDRPGDHQAVR